MPDAYPVIRESLKKIKARRLDGNTLTVKHSRADVIIKAILRRIRKFYLKKFYSETKYKTKSKKERFNKLIVSSLTMFVRGDDFQHIIAEYNE